MSPDPKISRKDQYFIHTMLKIHDTMDKNYKEKTDKEPGFLRLEDHRKNLILNASALPPYNRKAPKATEFVYQRGVEPFSTRSMIVRCSYSNYGITHCERLSV